ncbi:MAG: nucleotide exchange factor GrpE [Ilumatobacteraceae bacterium]
MSEVTPPPSGEPVAESTETESAEGGAATEPETVEPTELEVVTADRDEWMDRAQRIAADFENYRRRLTTQKVDDIDRATGRLAEALLPVLDACEAAFLQHPAEIEPLFNLMLSELKKQGLESMNLHEQPFDPHLADAVLHEPGDGEPVVSEVLRSGYTWNGKVLRPAMVKVRG